MIPEPERIAWDFSIKQTQALDILEDVKIQELLFGGAKGGAKMQDIHNLVCTPFGFRELGSLKIGSQVSNPDGTIARVIGIYPHGIKDIYKFTFDDGSSTECGLEHLWQVKVVGRTRFRKKEKTKRLTCWKVATTEEIIAELKKKKKILIPLTKPVEFTITSRNPNNRYPIHPYMLGVAIGDGCIRDNLEITSADIEIIKKLETLGYKAKRISGKKNSKASQYHYKIHGFKELGLLGHNSYQKFIPDRYKVCPKSMRIELLKGLMDTDGSADARGHASYCTTSGVLAKDVQWLAWSLGYKANITKAVPKYSYKGKKLEGRVAYRVWIKGDNHKELFSLPRKQNRGSLEYNNGLGFRTRKLISIEYSKKAECRCIVVDNPNGLYITDDFIVTHNTVLLVRWVYLYTKFLMDYFKIPKREHPVPVGFLGRKQFSLFKETTLESWKREIPASLYDLRIGNKEIIIDNAVKIVFGGFDVSEDLSKFQSAEYMFAAIDQAEELTKEDAAMIRGTLRLKYEGKVPPAYKILWTANPRNPCFLKTEFIDRRTPGRAFLKALAKDNPYLAPDYLDRLKEAWKHDPERYAALIEGDWNAISDNNIVIKEKWVRDAMLRRLFEPKHRCFIAVDVALEGNDRTVALYMENTTIKDKEIFGQNQAPECASRLHIFGEKHRRNGIKPTFIGDGDGLGSPVLQFLRDMGNEVIIYKGSEAAEDEDMYVNRRAEAHFIAARAFAGGEVALEQDEDLIDELSQATYFIASKGRIQIEPKVEIKKRLGKSPDLGDAYVIGLWGRRRIIPIEDIIAEKVAKQEGRPQDYFDEDDSEIASGMSA